ncbi:hypothetical protein BSKO_05902 [Bryopsis sp. KO-2023]|nr:hypothetical protein BSKO_05902 [Bryopsis sp. KO-2023]
MNLRGDEARILCEILVAVVDTKEVLAEVRDKKSREWLDRLPFGIDVEEPDEDCLKAVVRFARATGDLSFLSEVDVRVIALTRSLEKSVHGLENIKGLPEQVKVKRACF